MKDQQIFLIVAEELGIQWQQVKNTSDLLDAENTVPFIARYRKELTGSLDEDKIRQIKERVAYLRNLQQRKETILKTIREQGKLTPELEEKIHAALKLQELEDLYLPFRPKRRTRATIAKEKGLEPLAQAILAQNIELGQPEDWAKNYIDPQKEVYSIHDALSGAQDIVAENISESAEIRKRVRELTLAKGFFSSEARDINNCQEYELYKKFSVPISRLLPYQTLAINRGEREKILNVWIDAPEREIIEKIEKEIIVNKKSIFTEHLQASIIDSYRRLIGPAIEREVRHLLTERASEHAIHVFARNLRALLMTPPLRDKIILGIDPGYRTGCKIAVIDQTGKYLEGATIFPHEPQRQWQESKEILKEFIEDYHVDVIAIGNGTASRETEKLVAETISELKNKIHYTIVNEAGASVYSASEVAKKEFPHLEASMRGNISIARRLMDPLSELVKIEPRSIGVGLYQHDVDQARLKQALDEVVESCVNQVGVDVNTASASLLRYVAGITERVAENIVKYRDEHGKFKTREELKKVKGLGEKVFQQAAGFMKITDGEVFFDSTAVHPESYACAERLLSLLNLTVSEVKADGKIVRQRLQQIEKPIEEIAEQCGCGPETLQDIIESLEKPNRDPRDTMPAPILRSDVLSIDDLAVGMVLKGTVRNVVDFGAFVDIGVKEDGLVHLSKMAKKYVKNPLDYVSVGDIVKVKIISIDKERQRIGLSMVLDEP